MNYIEKALSDGELVPQEFSALVYEDMYCGRSVHLLELLIESENASLSEAGRFVLSEVDPRRNKEFARLAKKYLKFDDFKFAYASLKSIHEHYYFEIEMIPDLFRHLVGESQILSEKALDILNENVKPSLISIEGLLELTKSLPNHNEISEAFQLINSPEFAEASLTPIQKFTKHFLELW